MARYTGPKCRRCRQVGVKLFLKGTRCVTKCPLDNKKPFPPGQHGKSSHGKKSEYGKQLREKQKARYIYGMDEKQFNLTFQKAENKPGITGDILMELLERRMDNVIYKACFASSRNQARQYVGHGLFKVNNKKVDIPSMILKPGDKIEFTEKTKKSKLFEELKNVKIRAPRWLRVDVVKGSIELIDTPKHEDFDKLISGQSIVEFYSK